MDGLIKITRIPQQKNKISESEFNITTLFIENFDIDYESDFSLSYGLLPLSCGDRLLGYCELYQNLPSIPHDLMVFRPLKNEKHSNLIIDMFEELNIIESDNMEIREFTKNGKKRYSGCLKLGNQIIEESYIKSAPSIPILKVSIIAQLLLDDDDYNIFRQNLKSYLSRDKR